MSKSTIVIGVSEITELTVGQLAFFKVLAELQDSNFNQLNKLSLDDVFQWTLEKWMLEDPFEGVLEMERSVFERKLKLFLSYRFEGLIDIDALRQNIMCRIDEEYLP